MQRCCLPAFDDPNYILKTDPRHTDYNTRDKCMIRHQSPLSTTLIKQPQINSNGFWRFGWRPGSPCVSGAVVPNYLLFTSFLLYVISYIPLLMQQCLISQLLLVASDILAIQWQLIRLISIMCIIMQSFPFYFMHQCRFTRDWTRTQVCLIFDSIFFMTSQDRFIRVQVQAKIQILLKIRSWTTTLLCMSIYDVFRCIQ